MSLFGNYRPFFFCNIQIYPLSLWCNYQKFSFDTSTISNYLQFAFFSSCCTKKISHNIYKYIV